MPPPEPTLSPLRFDGGLMSLFAPQKLPYRRLDRSTTYQVLATCQTRNANPSPCTRDCWPRRGAGRTSGSCHAPRRG
ncbi:hypothetical protein IE81DRAFT_115663 [Ceraceosorus guamensis]|uniref:Uncharacterized protein n=1 Tax=Ceraceosorus guamensis TaxID=1522189 RepID=A0A316VZ45_9BASI|nr:hypothetical protein IE81DRAFT_115663 [Ceraceosorus guamensis]PWN42790.1 hypothetical protein IE81DRAFT_115663 [Ceraceosorus guamensis]